MLWIKKENKPLWGKYTSDTLCVGGSYTTINPSFNEAEIDDFVWESISQKARETLERKPAKGNYWNCTSEGVDYDYNHPKVKDLILALLKLDPNEKVLILHEEGQTSLKEILKTDFGYCLKHGCAKTKPGETEHKFY